MIKSIEDHLERFAHYLRKNGWPEHLIKESIDERRERMKKIQQEKRKG